MPVNENKAGVTVDKEGTELHVRALKLGDHTLGWVIRVGNGPYRGAWTGIDKEYGRNVPGVVAYNRSDAINLVMEHPQEMVWSQSCGVAISRLLEYMSETGGID